MCSRSTRSLALQHSDLPGSDCLRRTVPQSAHQVHVRAGAAAGRAAAPRHATALFHGRTEAGQTAAREAEQAARACAGEMEVGEGAGLGAG